MMSNIDHCGCQTLRCFKNHFAFESLTQLNLDFQVAKMYLPDQKHELIQCLGNLTSNFSSFFSLFYSFIYLRFYTSYSEKTNFNLLEWKNNL